MSAWVLAGVILTGAWTQLDEIGWLAAAPLAIVLALDYYRRDGVALTMRRPAPTGRAPVIAAALLCALHIAHVALTAREEFGFGGDEGYHLGATRAFALYYVGATPFLASSLAVFAVARWMGWRYAASAAMAALLVSSFFLPASVLFGRYPTGFYHLSTPLNAAFEVARVPYPFTANHIINVLSLPAWLFALRPLVIDRWPDWQVMPVALLIYFQAASLVYVGGTLLEPWAIVFLLLSVEALVVFPAEDRWVAVLLASAATFFKETAVLLLPTIWLLACVRWQGFRPSLRKHALASAVAAFTPFLVYYLVRIDAGIFRSVQMAPASDIWTETRLEQWLINVRAQLGVTAMAVVALLFVAMLRHVLWSLTALALAAFFFADALSLPYIGYGRFLAYSLVALGGAVIQTTHRVKDRRLLIAVSAVIAVLQIWPVARTFALDFRPDYERNSLEWRGAMVRLPIRTLIEKIPAFPGGLPSSVRVVTFGTDLGSLQVAYPDLANRYELRRGGAPGLSGCACRDNTEAVLAAFEWPANLGDTPAARATFEQYGVSCLQHIGASCRVYDVERDHRGAPVGIIGVGARK